MSEEILPFFTATTYQAVKAEMETIVRAQGISKIEALDQVIDAVEFCTMEVDVEGTPAGLDEVKPLDEIAANAERILKEQGSK